MSELLEDFTPQYSPGPDRSYKWAEWFVVGAPARLLRRGTDIKDPNTDYTCTDLAMRQLVWKHARRLGFRVSAHMDDRGTVIETHEKLSKS